MTESRHVQGAPDPRVDAFDRFTPTIHRLPGPTLRAAVSSGLAYNVCIVGASRGIGAGIALSYAKAGARILFLAARNEQQLRDVAHQIAIICSDCKVVPIACDVTSPASVQTLTATVRQVLGIGKFLNVLVLNSGYAGPVETEITQGSPTDGYWARAFEVNTLGTYHVAHYMIPVLLSSPADTKASFLVVGSISSLVRQGIVATSKYCVSKMAQLRIVEHVAQQFGDRGLFTAIIHPGAVATQMALDVAPEVFKDYLVDDPELCGHFMVWLTSMPTENHWLNGRFLSANWDPEELFAQRETITDGDLLKLVLNTR